MKQERVVFRIEGQVREALPKAGLGAGSTVVLAVSGGPDSLAMLYAIWRTRAELGLELHGAHLDHGLRGVASEEDARFVEETFGELAIEHTTETADVRSYQRRHRASLEEAAREVRYSFLATVARERDADAIVLAHTADDQAETVLMNVIRGSGVAGLRGMEPFSRRTIGESRISLVRPLLEVSRKDTEAYCRSLGLKPRMDQSNLSSEPMRNRVRLELLPMLEEYNPAVSDALVRLSRAAAVAVAHLDRQVDAVWEHTVSASPQQLDVHKDAFRGLDPAVQAHLLRRAVAHVGGSLSGFEQNHIDDMVRLAGGGAGRALSLPAGLRLTVSYEHATIAPVQARPCPLPPLRGDRLLEIPGQTQLAGWFVTANFVEGTEDGSRYGGSPVSPGHPGASARGSSGIPTEEPTGLGPDGLAATISGSALGDNVSIRPRRPGDRFQPLGMDRPKKLQDFMVDSKIPWQWRDRVPLVVCERGIAWVVGWRIADWARVDSSESSPVELRFEPRQGAGNGE